MHQTALERQTGMLDKLPPAFRWHQIDLGILLNGAICMSSHRKSYSPIWWLAINLNRITPERKVSILAELFWVFPWLYVGSGII
jgi:hypothetical protein